MKYAELLALDLAQSEHSKELPSVWMVCFCSAQSFHCAEMTLFSAFSMLLNPWLL